MCGAALARAQADVFRVECADLGELTHLTIGHDNTRIGAGWFLDEVRDRAAARERGGGVR